MAFSIKVVGFVRGYYDAQILLAIDDSESMADCGAGSLALAAMATVASGLTQLEVGQLAVARYGPAGGWACLERCFDSARLMSDLCGSDVSYPEYHAR